MHLLEVLNPVAQQRGVINAFHASPRPQSLDNKTVGLLWSAASGAENRVWETTEWLKREGYRSYRDSVVRLAGADREMVKSTVPPDSSDCAIGAPSRIEIAGRGVGGGDGGTSFRLISNSLPSLTWSAP
mgnify:CR=1 FL=1